MDLDTLAGAVTIWLVVAKLLMLFKERGSVPIFFIIFMALPAWAFYGNMQSIADAITGKDYIRGWRRFGGEYKVSRKNRIRYCFELISSILTSILIAWFILYFVNW